MNFEKQYPQPPAGDTTQYTQLSDSFRSQISRVILSILAFVLTYIVLVALALVLAWLCYRVGMVLILLHFHFILIVLGIGIMLMAALVIFFLVKFLFVSSKNEADTGIEIHESDEPELFAFIGRVADEVGTHFPRKVFLIPDVNASVFYNSSFASLLVPTRKNLNIGLGLINSVNLSEFKAVLAHEFGHFSQKSMRLGSYVYYVNQLIFNMLYQNDGWVNMANRIAGIHAILGACVQMAVYIVLRVQWVLRRMYGFVNRQYLRLSREMEFHADSISASVSGSNNMAQSLRQVEFGANTYHQVIEKCNEMLASEQAPVNAYVGQRAVAEHAAKVHELPLRQGLPVITHAFVQHQQRERVNFKDQWASHPTREEREASLKAIGLEAPVQSDSAWTVFQNPEQWQRVMTGFLYRKVEAKLNNLDEQAFVQLIQTEKAKLDLPKIYRGYYDDHFMNTDQWAETEKSTVPQPLDPQQVEALFADDLDKKIAALHHDQEVLTAIAEERIDTRSFDFDGKKYPREQANEIKETLVADQEQALKDRDQRDTQATAMFYAHALTQGAATADALKTAYHDLRTVDVLRKSTGIPAREILITIHYIARNNFNLATDMVQRFRELYNDHGPSLQQILQGPNALDLFPAGLQQKIRTTFIDTEFQYPVNNQPNQTELGNLHEVIFEMSKQLEESTFERQKAVLEMQAAFLS